MLLVTRRDNMEDIQAIQRESIIRTLVPMTLMLKEKLEQYEVTDGVSLPPKACIELLLDYNNYASTLYSGLGVSDEEYNKYAEENTKQLENTNGEQNDSPTK